MIGPALEKEIKMKALLLTLALSLPFFGAEAAAPEWKTFAGQDFAPAEGADPDEICPDGQLRYETTRAGFTLSLGANLSIEVRSAKSSFREGRPGKCIFQVTTEGSKTAVRRTAVTSDCADQSLHGTEEISLTIADANTLSYRKTNKDPKGKTTQDVACKLLIQKDD